MDQVIPGLRASAPMSPDFAPKSSVRAFLLERPEGNVLLYANDRVSAAEAGITRIYLSH